MAALEDPRGNQDIEIYKAVRAHEVMLNQAASAFEHAVYTRLAALNGGAAAAFVTLLGTQIKSTGGQLVSIAPAVIAVAAWLLGLLAASLAAVFGFGRQRAINHGYRLMREEVERMLGQGTVAEIVRPGRTSEEKKRLEKLDSEKGLSQAEKEKAPENRRLRAAYGRDAGKELTRFKVASGISVGLFMAGTIAALIAVVV